MNLKTLTYRLYGHESEKTLGDSGGEGSLVSCSSCSHRVIHDLVTETTTQNALGDLVKMQICNSAGLEWGPRFCISNKLPDVYPETHREEILHQIFEL